VPIADWIVERARRISDPQFVALAFPPAASVRVGVGESDEALALLAELEQTPNIRDTAFYTESLPDTVRSALAAADPDLAARLTDGLEPLHPHHQHALMTAQALLAEHRGDHAAAAAMFGQAAERWARFEMPWDRAQALLGRARCLLALGDVSEAGAAAACVHTAMESLISLYAAPELDAARTLLQQAIALAS
jgi:hypothetical protein